MPYPNVAAGPGGAGWSLVRVVAPLCKTGDTANLTFCADDLVAAFNLRARLPSLLVSLELHRCGFVYRDNLDLRAEVQVLHPTFANGRPQVSVTFVVLADPDALWPHPTLTLRTDGSIDAAACNDLRTLLPPLAFGNAIGWATSVVDTLLSVAVRDRDRAAAFVLSGHPRAGQHSPAKVLDRALRQHICSYIHVQRNWTASTFLPANLAAILRTPPAGGDDTVNAINATNLRGLAVQYQALLEVDDVWGRVTRAFA